jgi:hypothetical protein
MIVNGGTVTLVYEGESIVYITTHIGVPTLKHTIWQNGPLPI